MGLLSAVEMTQPHQEPMILLEEGNVSRQRLHEESAKRLVARLPGNPAMPRKDAKGVGVDDERGLFGRVKDDAVRRLGTDSVHPQQLDPQAVHVLRKKAVQIALPVPVEMAEEGFQAPCLLIEISRGADEKGQFATLGASRDSDAVRLYRRLFFQPGYGSVEILKRNLRQFGGKVPFLKNIDNNAGMCTLGLTSPDVAKGFKGGNNLVVLVFDAVAAGESPVTISNVTANASNGQLVQFQLGHSRVVIR